ncbi:hypothetical protein RND81_06G070100 [Saponaria officinalis]|uniref:Uncharacterized protein n=1 Tax=Saponaria officinalis TaxID=3572 RepID=A0AAW1K8P6_SAPOF
MTASTLYRTARGYMFCSLEMGNRLHPWRIFRQFGREQRIPYYDTEVVEPVLLTNGMIEDWLRRWADRTSWTVRSTPESNRVTDAYTKWTVAKEVRDRDRQRGREKIEPRPTLSRDLIRHSRDYSDVIPVVRDAPPSVFTRLGNRPGVRDLLGSRIEEPPARDRMSSRVVVPERKDEAESSQDAKRRKK